MDNFLIEMLSHVEEQYSVIERECSVLRKLLKPWPKKKRDEGQKIHPTDNAGIISANKVKEEDDMLSSVEKLALEQMERLLSKAEKTMKIKEKREQLNDPSDHEACIDNSTHLVESDTKEKSNDMGSELIVNEISSSKTQPAAHQIKTLKQNSQSFSCAKQNPPSLKPPSAKISSKDIKKQNQTASSRQPSRNVTSRCSSASSISRPLSSKSRFTPAHINAPFKTDTNTKVPHKKLNHAHKNHQTKTAHLKKQSTGIPTNQKQSSFSNSLKKLPNIPAKIKVNEKELEACTQPVLMQLTEDIDPVNINGNNIIEVADTDSNQPISSRAGVDLVIDNAQDERSTCDKMSVCEDNVNHQMVNDVISGSSSIDLSDGRENSYFSLKDKSSKVKVPSRLAKAVAENRSLFEKCSTAQLVRRTRKEDTAAVFVKRLEESNTISPELYARAKALSCLQSHELMMQSLQSLKMEQITDTTPFETAFRTKRLLEFILSKFAQCQDETDYFTRVQFKSLPTEPAFVSAEDNNNVVKSLFVKPDKELKEYRSDMLDALASSRVWTRLQFEKNISLLRQHIMSLSEKEWWEILAQDPRNDTVVQLVHSLLTSTGEFCTAVVKNPES